MDRYDQIESTFGPWVIRNFEREWRHNSTPKIALPNSHCRVSRIKSSSTLLLRPSFGRTESQINTSIWTLTSLTVTVFASSPADASTPSCTAKLMELAEQRGVGNLKATLGVMKKAVSFFVLYRYLISSETCRLP